MSIANDKLALIVGISDLKPRDRIDVQSFIWVIGAYKDETEQPKP
jgi:hypothetical protein